LYGTRWSASKREVRNLERRSNCSGKKRGNLHREKKKAMTKVEVEKNPMKKGVGPLGPGSISKQAKPT